MAFSVGFHGLSFVGWWWLGSVRVSETVILLLFSLLCLWVPLAIFTLFWLLWKNRQALESPLVWIAFQVLFFILLFGGQLSNATLSSLSGIYSILFLPVLFVSDFLFACFRHSALHLLGFGSLTMIWSIVIGGRIQGDLLLIFIQSIGEMRHPLLWLIGVMTSMAILILAGLVALIVESLHVLLQEVRIPLDNN